MSDQFIHLQEDGPCEGGRGQGQVAVDRLPDNVLLEIFDFYRDDPAVHICEDLFRPPWRWTTLTQVCRRWRCVIFGSPRRLGLQVVCTKTTPTTSSLDIWPPFPIVVHCSRLLAGDEKGVENLIAAVEHRDRVSHIHVDEIHSSALEKLTAVMQEPRPFLTYLHLSSTDRSVQVLPETFLGGSCTLLKTFVLLHIPFPTFPEFILSATNIAYLVLGNIPDSGYISPEVMTTCLAALPNLQSLTLTTGRRFPSSHPLPTSLLSPTRVVLPALTDLYLGYTVEYSEAIIGRIDTPLLSGLTIIFLRDVLIGDMPVMPQIHSLIGRIQGLKPFNRATIEFDHRKISMVLGYLESPTTFELEILYETIHLQLSPMTQIFGQRLPLLSHVEELHMTICHDYRFRWTSLSDPSLWLQHFHLFVALQTLYVSEGLMKPIEYALQELVGGRTMEVLPALRELLLEGLRQSDPTPEGIELFDAARELSGHPIIIGGWVAKGDGDEDEDEDEELYISPSPLDNNFIVPNSP